MLTLQEIDKGLNDLYKDLLDAELSNIVYLMSGEGLDLIRRLQGSLLAFKREAEDRSWYRHQSTDLTLLGAIGGSAIPLKQRIDDISRRLSELEDIRTEYINKSKELYQNES